MSAGVGSFWMKECRAESNADPLADYNGEPMKLKNWREVIYNRLHIQGESSARSMSRSLLVH